MNKTIETVEVCIGVMGIDTNITAIANIMIKDAIVVIIVVIGDRGIHGNTIIEIIDVTIGKVDITEKMDSYTLSLKMMMVGLYFQ
jgi:hypothetical protein